MAVFVGTNIRNYMKAMAISFSQLSEATNLAVTTIIRMHDCGDAPDYNVRHSSLCAIAKVMGVTPETVRYRDIYAENIPVKPFTIAAQDSHEEHDRPERMPLVTSFLLVESSKEAPGNLREFYYDLNKHSSSFNYHPLLSRSEETQYGFRIIGNEMSKTLSKGDVVVFQYFEDVNALPIDPLVLAIVEPRPGFEVVVVRQLIISDYGDFWLVKNSEDTAPIAPKRILGHVVGRYSEFRNPSPFA